MRSLLYIANLRLPTDKAHGIQIANMCEAFAGIGFRVDLIVPTRHNPITEDFFLYYGVSKSFNIVRLYSPDFHLPGKIDRVAVHIKNIISGVVLAVYSLFKNPEIIYSRDEFPLYLLSFFRKNLFFEVHKFSSSRLKYYRRFIRADCKLIAISAGLKQKLVDCGFNPEQVRVAHDGVNVERFSPSLSKEECRVKAGLPQAREIIGYVGQLRTMGMEKGVADLIKAFALIRSQRPDTLLVIVGGTDADIHYYSSLAEEHHIDGNSILFLGRRAHGEIPIFLRAFDVLAMPFPNYQHYASFMSPLKLFEYMASGRPIVATDLPTVREVLSNTNAVLVRPNDVDDIARGLLRIFQNPQLGNRLASQALTDVQQYAWTSRASNILAGT